VTDGLQQTDPGPPLRRLLVLAGAVVLVLVLAAVGTSAALPRNLDAGTTMAAAAGEVEVTPGLLTPRFRVQVGEQDVRLRGARWPGELQVARHVFDDPLTGQPAMTVLVGSAPLRADSVRVVTSEDGVREATLRFVGWHRVHVTVYDGEVTIREVAAIGSGGEVLQVVEGPDLS